MNLSHILVIIIILCLAVIIFILGRKLPFLVVINPNQFAKKQQTQIKNLILKERLKRKIIETKKIFSLWFLNLSKKIKRKS